MTEDIERRDSVYFPRDLNSEPIRHHLSSKTCGYETPPLRRFFFVVMRRHKILFGFER